MMHLSTLVGRRLLRDQKAFAYFFPKSAEVIAVLVRDDGEIALPFDRTTDEVRRRFFAAPFKGSLSFHQDQFAI